MEFLSWLRFPVTSTPSPPSVASFSTTECLHSYQAAAVHTAPGSLSACAQSFYHLIILPESLWSQETPGGGEMLWRL